MINVPKSRIPLIQSGRQTAVLIYSDTRPCWPHWEPQPVRAGGKVLLMVRVVACDQVRMGQLTNEDAAQLGFASLGKLRVDWDRRHRPGSKWHPNRRVWKVRFVYGEPPADMQQSTLFALIAKEAP